MPFNKLSQRLLSEAAKTDKDSSPLILRLHPSHCLSILTRLISPCLPAHQELVCCSKYPLNYTHSDAPSSFPTYLVQEPDPNQPKPEGQQMSPLEGEHHGVVNKWPPSLPAALQRWGTTQPKSSCLTALDNAGKPVYTLTYGRYQPVDDP